MGGWPGPGPAFSFSLSNCFGSFVSTFVDTFDSYFASSDGTLTVGCLRTRPLESIRLEKE